MQDQVDAAGIDTVWFGVAADLNADFAAKSALLIPVPHLNELGHELLGLNTQTFKQVMSGEISASGMALDNLLVVREQVAVQSFYLRNYGASGPNFLTNGYIQASFVGGDMALSPIISAGVTYVSNKYGSFNYWDTSHRIELGQAMMSQRRHGVN